MKNDYIATVSELNEYASGLIARDPLLTDIGVRGEISGYKRHSSGHVYFTLKDQAAQLRCVMFRQYAQMLSLQPIDGMQVTAYGSVSLYVRDGQFQLYVRRMEQQGEGELYRRFLLLKTKLQAKGYFDQQHKKNIPLLPRAVGVVTSKTGAVIEDIRNVISRRFPGMPIELQPASVQGLGAAQEIAAAIKRLDENGKADVIIVGRGGGSIEDLWAFNEECVADAIYACDTPVISAVGHETDTTIADFVADLRAPTPSAAAELAVPERQALYDQVFQARDKLFRAALREIELRRKTVASIRDSGVLYRLQAKRMEQLHRQAQMQQQAQRALCTARQSLQAQQEHLHLLDPRRVLERGYVLVSDEAGRTLTSAAELVPEQHLILHLRDGVANVRVNSIEERKYHNE